MKCYYAEFNYNNSPDTELVFVFAESAEEAAAALSMDSDEVNADDMSVVDTDSKFYKSWAKRSNTYYVIGEELTQPGMYDNERDYRIDMELYRAEMEGRLI